jgi:hypothetical protein
MHLKELTHRSPLRVFERSLHGGLGKGNLGIVIARSGVGKSAFLTLLAIDELLRDRKVLHVVTRQSVDHVREYYDEIFADLASAANLEESVIARDRIEHNRFIRSLSGRPLSLDAFAQSLGMLRRDAGFRPDVVLVDGYHFDEAPVDELRQLRELVRHNEAELWMSMRLRQEDEPDDWRVLPQPVDRLQHFLSVCVLLQPVGDGIRIRLLKDHDNPKVADLSLDLDPRTYLVRPV